MKQVIAFKDFSFRYDNLKNPTLKNIHLTINKGEKVLIAGPSGSGKSTLAHCINGLIPFAYKGHTSGALEVVGEATCHKDIYEMSQMVGTILQDADGQFVALTVAEDVAFALENECIEKEEMKKRVTTLLDTLDMKDFEEYAPDALSGGQKQKIAMAGVLAMDAPILLFDEPLANLDPLGGKRAMETITKLHKESQKTIVVVEHRIEDVLEHGFDRVILMDGGCIVFDGTPDEVLRQDKLRDYGLREPLYIETLRALGIDVSQESTPTDIQSLKHHKEQIEAKMRKIQQEEPQEAPKEVILEAKNLCFKYDEEGKKILEDVNFKVYEGELLAILGNNGAGKSTLLKVLTGFNTLHKGDICFRGMSIAKEGIRKRAQKIGYVMQNPNHMITKYMIYDEIAYGLQNYGYSKAEIDKRVEEVLEICNIKKYRKWPIALLSYGQKKRVTIASILALRPSIIVLDEPTAGQDYKNYTEFMSFLKALKAEGITVVMITHDMQLAHEYADRAIVLSAGKVVAEGRVSQILQHKAMMKQANLKQTSIATLAEVLGLEDVSGFVESMGKLKNPQDSKSRDEKGGNTYA